MKSLKKKTWVITLLNFFNNYNILYLIKDINNY